MSIMNDIISAGRDFLHVVQHIPEEKWSIELENNIIHFAKRMFPNRILNKPEGIYWGAKKTKREIAKMIIYGENYSDERLKELRRRQ